MTRMLPVTCTSSPWRNTSLVDGIDRTRIDFEETECPDSQKEWNGLTVDQRKRPDNNGLEWI